MICVDVVDCHSVIVLTYVLVCAANNICCVSKSLSVFLTKLQFIAWC